MNTHTDSANVVSVSVPGRHNALNALAAIATGRELGLDFESMSQAITAFHGAKRRFQIIGEHKGITVIDDYAHHPTEIKATLRAARSYHSGRLITVFQPHRYSRTRQLGAQLGEALQNCTWRSLPIYIAAGEAPIPGVTAILFLRQISRLGVERFSFLKRRMLFTNFSRIFTVQVI